MKIISQGHYKYNKNIAKNSIYIKLTQSEAFLIRAWLMGNNSLCSHIKCSNRQIWVSSLHCLPPILDLSSCDLLGKALIVQITLSPNGGNIQIDLLPAFFYPNWTKYISFYFKIII